MTRRMWSWAGALTVLGGVLLAVTIHARAEWQPPPKGEAVLTLDQLLGFTLSATLIVVAGLVLLAGLHRERDRRRHQRLVRRQRELDG